MKNRIRITKESTLRDVNKVLKLLTPTALRIIKSKSYMLPMESADSLQIAKYLDRLVILGTTANAMHKAELELVRSVNQTLTDKVREVESTMEVLKSDRSTLIQLVSDIQELVMFAKAMTRTVRVNKSLDAIFQRLAVAQTQLSDPALLEEITGKSGS